MADSDLVGLDRLLEYYRGPRARGCTTWQEATFRLKVRGKVIREETYVDGSCGWDKVPGIRTIDALVDRMASSLGEK